mgnify:FL=1
MSRVLLAGCAGGAGSSGEGACIARTGRFLSALEGAGHSVDMFEPSGPGSRRDLRRILRSGRYDVVTAISPYPAEAVLSAGCLPPLWIDINGAHPAEVFHSSDDPVTRRIHTIRVLSLESAILRGGDAFSTPSRRQRLAVLGELLLLGRFSAASQVEPPVHAIPHCASQRRPSPARPAPGGTFSIISTGSFNTWFDHRTLFAALEAVMEADNRVTFTATGGPVRHSGSGWAEFSDLVHSSRTADRFLLEGWLPDGEMERVYSAASAAVFTDLPGLETELGARTRVLDWISRGIPVVCTSGSEIAEDIAAAGMGIVVPQGDPAALASALLSLARDPALGDGIRSAQAAWSAGSGSMREVFAPYLGWVEEPRRVLSNPVSVPAVPPFRTAGYHRVLVGEIVRAGGVRKAAGRILARIFRRGPAPD